MSPNHDIVARRFDADGTPQGADFTINSTTSGYQQRPAAIDEAGNFVVIWSSTRVSALTDVAWLVVPDFLPSTFTGSALARRRFVIVFLCPLRRASDHRGSVSRRAEDVLDVDDGGDRALLVPGLTG